MLSVRKTIPLERFSNYHINMEIYESGQEVADLISKRQMTDPSFHGHVDTFSPSFNGVSSYEEALNLLSTGYPEATEKLKKYESKINLQGETKRVSFTNEVVGFAPIVPLSLIGVPNCMMNTRVVPIKSKVLNVYYDVGAIGGVDTSRIMNAGCKLLGALMELEMAGYRFNLYAVKSQSECGDPSADVLCVKIKDAGRPFDLKRLSFPLAHPAFFRAIAWNWYARVPGGKFRSGLGHSLTYDYSSEQLTPAFEKLFNQKCVVLGLKYILDNGDEYLKKALTGGQYAKV